LEEPDHIQTVQPYINHTIEGRLDQLVNDSDAYFKHVAGLKQKLISKLHHDEANNALGALKLQIHRRQMQRYTGDDQTSVTELT
jgi:hypothetical protein